MITRAHLIEGLLMLGIAGCLGGCGALQSGTGGGGNGGGGGGSGSGTAPSSFVFVSNETSNSISGFAIDKNTGGLTPIPGSPFASAQPAGLATDPSGNFLVVANKGGQVSVFRIGRTTGILSPATGSPFPGHGQPYVAAIKNGFATDFVYVGNLASNDISAYTLDHSTGALTEVAGSPFSTGGIVPQSMTVDLPIDVEIGFNTTPLLVVGGTELANFRIESDGRLTKLNASSKVTAVNWVTSRGDYLYVSSANGIAVFDEHVLGAAPDCDPTTAFLDCSVGSYLSGGVLSSVAANASDSLVVVADFKSSDVKALSVAKGVFTGTSGTLTQVDEAPTGTGPFSVAIDASGNFLYVANQASGSVSAFRIDPTTLKLGVIQGSPFATGQGPTFLVMVP